MTPSDAGMTPGPRIGGGPGRSWGRPWPARTQPWLVPGRPGPDLARDLEKRGVPGPQRPPQKVAFPEAQKMASS